MKIAVFGAAGRTGRNVVEGAISRGYEVTAFIHTTKAFEGRTDVSTVSGDAFDEADVEKAILGNDAVLSALGRSSSGGLATFAGTKNIVDAMEKNKVKRLIVQSAFGAGESAREISVLDRYFVTGLLLRAGYRAKDMLEDYVEKSTLDWVIVRPPRLTDGPRRGIYRAGEHIPLSLASGISRADVADFMLKQVEGNEFVHKKPSIGY
ncbi:MAG TPA: SDR family oxidoreductase [Nitrososphaerales archaeon]|nr:SDR family oxidoreductase [Nitrososphaerales archaeon]